jgi:hypothetical protein
LTKTWIIAQLDKKGGEQDEHLCRGSKVYRVRSIAGGGFNESVDNGDSLIE